MAEEKTIVYFGEFPSKKALEKSGQLRTPPIGAIAYCKDSKTYYEYKDYGGWAVKANNSRVNLEMSIYDMNAQIISQMPNPDEEYIAEAIDKINLFDEKHKNKYYMFLCKEASYFTTFVNTGDGGPLGNQVVECAKDIGNIKLIDDSNEGEVEVWTMFDSKAYCIHLIPYDIGTIHFGG